MFSRRLDEQWGKKKLLYIISERKSLPAKRDLSSSSSSSSLGRKWKTFFTLVEDKIVWS